MTITVQSAKAKGRNLQKLIRDKLLELFPTLEQDDVKSTAMGSQGEDIQLSPAARKLIPYSIEAKAKNKHAVYNMYDQAVANAKSHEPLLVIKQDRRKPLAVVDLDHFLKLIQERK